MLSPNKLLNLTLARAIAAGIAAACFLVPQQGWADGSSFQLPGNFAVTPGGQASYDVPIAVPPGTAGMVPAISLHYSSGGGNGIVGMGWSLTGLPSVTRCAPTIGQDKSTFNSVKISESVQFTSADDFCFGGQKLVAINGGTYGGDTTLYRTELEGFTQIESHSSSGSTTPSWFELWTKAGLHMTFGYTSDSANSQIRNIAGNSSAKIRSTTIASWAVSGVSDVKGNYYVVQYSTQDTATGEYRPTEIDYTGNSNTQQSPYNSIIFKYSNAQPSPIVTTASGSINTTTVLLSNIQTRLGIGGSGTLISDYQLAYTKSTTNRETLQTISHCDGSGNCLPSDNFTYSSANMISNFSTKVPSSNIDGYTPYYGDFLGVGATSIFWANAAGSNSVLWMNDGSGNFTVNSSKKPLVLPKLAPDNTTTCTSYRGYTGDFDGDGKTDIYWDCNDAGGYVGQGYLWISNGDGTFTSYGENFNVDGFYWPCIQNCPINTPENVYQIATVDLNGDGRTDLIMYYTGLGPKEAPYLSAISKGDGTFSTAQQNFPVTTGLNYTFQAADFNGDGKSDLFLYEIGKTGSYTGNYYLLIGQGDGSFINQAVTVSDSVAPNGSVVWQPYVANFGLGANAGILWKDMSSSDGTGGNGNRKLWLGNGDGSFSVIGNTSLPSSTNPWASGTHKGYLPYFGDFQGTGRTDILWYDRTTYTRDLWLNNGDGTFRAVGDFAGATSTDLSGTSSSANALPTIADFTGHGKAEILWQVTSTTTGGTFGAPVLWTTDATQADLLSSLTTGLGATTQINYNTLANYASGSAGANYIQCSATTTGTAVNHVGVNQTICPVASYPTIDLQSSMPIVSSVLLPTANSSSPTFALTYAYEGAKLDVNGRGFLGFSQQTVTDALGNVTISDFSPLWPLTGAVWHSERDNNGVTLTSISSGYSAAAPSLNSVAQTGTLANGSADSSYLNVMLAGSIQADIDLNGTPMGSTNTSYTYDDYDNVLTSTVAVTDPTTTPWTGAVYKTVTTDQYWNVSPWGMGKLACSQVSNTAPSGSGTTTQTRTQAWTYDQTWLMANYYVEPDGTAVSNAVPSGGTVAGCQGTGGAAEVTTEVSSRDAYGNATDILYIPNDGISATREIQTKWADGENRFPTKIIIGHTGPQYTTSYAYNNDYGTVGTITDANSLVDKSQYDTFGRKLNESHTDGSYETWGYNACKSIGGSQSCNPGLQAQIAYRDYGNDQATAIAPNETDSYDALGRLAYKQRTGFSMVMQTLYAYDGNFNLFTVTGPFDGNTVTQPVTQYSYDAERRPTSVAYADSSIDKTGYNGLSQTVTKANKEAVTLYQHRNGDQWMSVDPLKNTTTYTDSVFNEIVSSVDPAGDTTSYGYDHLGRVNSVADPDAGITSTSYSSFGQALVVATPTGQAHMAYDDFGRMTIRNDYDTSSNVQLGSTWTYDTGSGGPNGACIGLLGSATATGNATVSGGYVRTQRYNSVCQPTGTTVALGGTGGTTHSITDSYSTIGEYSGTAYPSGFSTSINYTAGSYISTITGTNPATGAQATLYTVGGRDASARPTSVVYGNNLTTNFKYDVGERVNSIVTSSASSTLLSMTYGWNSISDGKLGTRAQSGVIGTSNSYSLAEKFSYDTLNELTQVTNTATNSVETSFGYVQNSNGTPDGTFRLATKSDVGTYSYNSTTRPHAVRSIAGTVNGSFTYDAAGETLSDASGRTYQWFPFGLVNSVTQGSTTLSFSYDPEHRRIQMVAPEGTTRYYWSAHASIELTPNGTWQDYISGPEGLIGTGDGNASGYTIYYLHNDYQQSVTLESNSGGTAQAELAYDAWGKRRHPDGTPDTTDSLMNGSISDRNYIGEEALDDVSLMNLNVRLYDPYLGRFTTPDPSGQAGGINVFGYGGNDPISASDPTGLAADCPPGPDGIATVCVNGTPIPPVPGLSLSDFNGFDFGVSDGFSDTSIMSIKIASKEGVTVSSGAPTSNNQSYFGGVYTYSPSDQDNANTTPGFAQPVFQVPSQSVAAPAPQQGSPSGAPAPGNASGSPTGTAASSGAGGGGGGPGSGAGGGGGETSSSPTTLTKVGSIPQADTPKQHSYHLSVYTFCPPSIAFGMMQMPMMSAPGAPYALPGFHAPINLLGNNPISQDVNTSDRTILNTTLPGHTFYPGTVLIQVNPVSLGPIPLGSTINVTGQGAGNSPLVNDVVGLAYFGITTNIAVSACRGGM